MKELKKIWYVSIIETYQTKFKELAPLNKKQLARLITSEFGGNEDKHYQNLLRISEADIEEYKNREQ